MPLASCYRGASNLLAQSQNQSQSCCGRAARGFIIEKIACDRQVNGELWGMGVLSVDRLRPTPATVSRGRISAARPPALRTQWTLALLACTCLSSPAWAVDFNVNSDATLRSAITSAASGDRIVFQNNITLSADLPAVQTNVTIVGNNNALSGNNQFRGLFVGAFSGSTQTAVTVAIQDLAITNTKASGGTGGAGGTGVTAASSGGGGGGLGGAIFVANLATVTVSNVSLTSNAAAGGSGGGASGITNNAGGGGGMGGNGGSGGAGQGGGGGLGVGANGGNAGANNGSAGIATGAASGGSGSSGGGGGGPSGGGGGGSGGAGGGGGGVGGGGGAGITGGAGRFGGGGGGGAGGVVGLGGVGGGGGGAPASTGGAGGFGGGGGGTVGVSTGGTGGFGGGAGATNGGGGGGLGAGGAIFVQGGGNLTLAGPLTVNGNSVTAGSGSNGGGTGSAFGSGLFLQGNGTVTFSAAAGQNQTVANVIADQTGSGGTGVNAGSYSLAKTGTGTLTLSAANTYTGGTSVTGGLINFAAAGNFGSGTIALNGGGLQWASGTTTDISGQLAAIGAGGGTLDTNGNNVTLASSIGGGGSVTKTGVGTLTLGVDNGFTGGLAINGGIVAAASDSRLGGPGGALSFNGGTLQALGVIATNRAITLNAGGGTIDTQNNAMVVSSVISGPGGLTKNGAGILDFQNANTYTGGTTINAGTLVLDSVGGSLPVGGALTVNGGLFDMSQISTGQTVGALAGTGGQIALGANTLTTNSGANTTLASQITGTGSLVKQGSGILTLTSSLNNYTGGTTIQGGLVNFASPLNLGSGLITMNGGGLQWATGNTTDISFQLAALGAGGGIFDTNGNNVRLSQTISGAGALTKQGQGTLTLGGNNLYSGGTIVTGGLINFSSANSFGTGAITLNGGGLQWATGSTADISAKLAPLGAGGGTFDTNGNTVTFASGLSGSGGLTKQGNGTLILTAANSYSGGTTVSGGILQGNTQSLQGNILNNAAVVFNQTGAGTYGGVMSGTGTLTLMGGGSLNLTGTNTYTGGTAVLAGTLAVNGSVAGNVAVGPAGTLGGNGTIGGNVVTAGILAPGNSIGTLNISGSFTQAAGSTYQVEANAAGQADRINVGGAAAIQGGTVQVLAQPGSYANSTTYTIVRATGGVSGTYAGVTSNFAFLTPTLSYDANDVFLTLALPTQNAFTPTFLALTPNQKAVGVALNQSFATASGDFAAVLGVIAGLNTVQGPLALNTISGEPYADFGTMNTNSSMMFMNAIGQQMANARGAASAGQRQALAQACEIESCDAVGPLSAWFSALGGLGSVLGDTNASTLTYNFGGAAAGIDYRLDPRFLVGIGVGYTHGTQWVNTFMGQGWTDSVSVAAYGSFTQGGFYVDALAGYAYFNNQLQRQILIPGLQQRTATGSTGANQFLGQIEGGYKVGLYAPAAATITPFGRFQISSVTQNAFSESGAQSLSLNVAQQTTNSQRTTIGADLGSSIGLGNERKLDLAVRLGWMHEFADVARPITAAFAGAPGNSFTVFGATPLRNAAVVGLQATTTIAPATQIYLRYDGEIATGTDNHALNIGVRMSW
jgi:outer membrane autotransporter protein